MTSFFFWLHVSVVEILSINCHIESLHVFYRLTQLCGHGGDICFVRSRFLSALTHQPEFQMSDNCQTNVPHSLCPIGLFPQTQCIKPPQ